MVETIHAWAPPCAAAARWRPLLGALGCGLSTLAAAAGEVTLSGTVATCPPAICDPTVKSVPDPTPGQVIVPGDGIYRVLGTRVRPDDKAPGSYGVEFDVCVSNESRDRPVTQVLVAAAVQTDAGAARQVRSYLVKLPQPLKPGEAGCARGGISTPFTRPLVFVAQPAN